MANVYSSADEITAMGQAFKGLKERNIKKKQEKDIVGLMTERNKPLADIESEKAMLANTEGLDTPEVAAQRQQGLDVLKMGKANVASRYDQYGGLDATKVQGMPAAVQEGYQQRVAAERQRWEAQKTSDTADALINWNMTGNPNVTTDVFNKYHAQRLGVKGGIKEFKEGTDGSGNKNGTWTIITNDPADQQPWMKQMSKDKLDQMQMVVTDPTTMNELQRKLAGRQYEGRGRALEFQASMKEAYGDLNNIDPVQFNKDLQKNPFFRAQFEAQTGAKFNPDQDNLKVLATVMNEKGVPWVYGVKDSGEKVSIGQAPPEAKSAEEWKAMTQAFSILPEMWKQAQASKDKSVIELIRHGKTLGLGSVSNVDSGDSGAEAINIGDVVNEVNAKLADYKSQLANARTPKQKQVLESNIQQHEQYLNSLLNQSARFAKADTTQGNITETYDKLLQFFIGGGVLPRVGGGLGFDTSNRAGLPTNTADIEHTGRLQESNARVAMALPGSIVGGLARQNIVNNPVPEPAIANPNVPLNTGGPATAEQLIEMSRKQRLPQD